MCELHIQARDCRDLVWDWKRRNRVFENWEYFSLSSQAFEVGSLCVKFCEKKYQFSREIDKKITFDNNKKINNNGQRNYWEGKFKFNIIFFMINVKFVIISAWWTDDKENNFLVFHQVFFHRLLHFIHSRLISIIIIYIHSSSMIVIYF
jgi:hypothetical protein